MMVDIGEEKGEIEADEKQMIENVFEFNNMTAEECMVHRKDVTAIDVEDEPGRHPADHSGQRPFPLPRLRGGRGQHTRHPHLARLSAQRLL